MSVEKSLDNLEAAVRAKLPRWWHLPVACAGVILWFTALAALWLFLHSRGVL